MTGVAGDAPALQQRQGPCGNVNALNIIKYPWVTRYRDAEMFCGNSLNRSEFQKPRSHFSEISPILDSRATENG